MIKDALQYLLGLSEPHIIKEETGIYTDKQLTRLTEPLAANIEVSTLTAMLDYIRDNRDELYLDQMMIHIVSPTSVSLISVLNNDAKREAFIISNANLPKFTYGSFYDSESFNIAMQAMFVDADDRAVVIKMAGNLMEEGVKQSIDNGMTQTAVVRTGIKAVGYSEIPNPVTLRPFRTFIEVEQPASKFVFRVREGSHLALFEADGGAWRNVAMANIKNYLDEELACLDIKMTILA